MAGTIRLIFTDLLKSTDFPGDADLAAACRRRELKAFEQLYQLYGPRLKSLAYHLLGNTHDAEDAVQETFLRAYRRAEGFHGDAHVSTWMCRILINCCYDVTRKRRREAPPPSVEPGRPSQVPLRLALQSALARLHPRNRMVFLLFEVEGWRHSEIASILEVPEGTSRAWLFEAKKELKRMLTEVRP